jgi:uncharacterized DUF497 family protein
MVFQWDAGNREHIKRHGVTPKECETAMSDAVATAPSLETNEPRWKTIGVVHGRRLAVIWTPRNEAIRVVTAYWQSRKRQ